MAFALLAVGCAGVEGGGDGGDAGGSESDGGLADAGGGTDGAVIDGGADGGVDGGCAGCGECPPDETRCEGVLVSTCDAQGRWAPAVACGAAAGVAGLCRGAACVPVSSCEAELPPCCALPLDCGPLQWRFTCPECRPVDAEADCLAGVCADRTLASANITIRATARDLLPTDRVAVRSGVLTFYRSLTSEGRTVDCALVASGAHDQHDPALNVVHSRYLDYQAGTGNDLFDARVRGLPREPDQTLVLTVYDAYQGRGRAVARACAAPVSFSEGDMIVIDLVALP